MEMNATVSSCFSIRRRRAVMEVKHLGFSSSSSSSSSLLLLLLLSTNNKMTRSSSNKEYIKKKKKGMSCNALFGLGVPELAVIAGVAALVFGPKKLPEVGRSIGQTFKTFQLAAKEFESELKKEPDSSKAGGGVTPIAVTQQEKQKQDTQEEEEEVSSNSKDSSVL